MNSGLTDIIKNLSENGQVSDFGQVLDFDRVVEKVRKSLTVHVDSENQERTYTTKHGTVATMKTGNIGKAIAKSIRCASLRRKRSKNAQVCAVDRWPK